MTTYERQQTILALLAETMSLKVTELAARLEVSEGTIRNDLNRLEHDGLLRRVRGGATLINKNNAKFQINHRATINSENKIKIAKRAAELVNDGDVILLDASTTVLYMTSFLQDRRDLTIVTNQLELAQIMARVPQTRVILLGGIVDAEGSKVNGSISQEILKDLHINTAFVSSVGFSFDSGLMEGDIDEAEFKEQVIKSASKVVAVLDSSKFEKVSLKPFAKIEQISHIITDDSINSDTVKKLREFKLSLTICGEHTIQSYLASDKKTAQYKIGFAGLSEQVPFAVEVRRGLERAAKEYNNIDLVIADNDLSGDKAIQIAERFIEQDLDLVIEYQINEHVGNFLLNRFQQNNIPVIAVDIPIVGATYFGVENYQAGLLAGQALGNWILKNWQGDVDYVFILEEKRAGPLPAARIQGQIHGLEQKLNILVDEQKILLDSGNTTQRSFEQSLNALKQIPAESKIAVLCFNDDAALGALSAFEKLNREQTAAIVGQGADWLIRKKIKQQVPSIVGSTAFMPEHYGAEIIKLALKIINNEAVAPAIYVQHKFIDKTNIDDFVDLELVT
ncbi:MAG TPA: DeoR family transcriptional regulator [Trueperaceae bacterium]|nr:DeoR family transcriptional regulator [Trueperaceae bacterium]